MLDADAGGGDDADDADAIDMHIDDRGSEREDFDNADADNEISDDETICSDEARVRRAKKGKSRAVEVASYNDEDLESEVSTLLTV